ncbi:MAG: HEAT repeat domain-containing protein [Planctomycetota bacterium]|nr:MAG: HEAT repeat domain-containing protein [Planctomycetota bacterium]
MLRLLLGRVALSASVLLFSAVAPSVWGQSVDQLLSSLDPNQEHEAVVKIDGLGQLGEAAKPAVEKLIALSTSDSPVIRAHALHALGKIGDTSEATTKAVLRGLGDDDPVVRRAAVSALDMLDVSGETVWPLLIERLEDADPGVRLRTIATIAEHGDAAVPALIKALDDDDTAYWACLILAEVGPDAAPATAKLTELLDRSQSPDVRREAVLALGAIGPEAASAKPKLTELLEDPVQAVPAMYALVRIGDLDAAIVEKIEALTSNDDPITAAAASWALAKLNPDDESRMQEAVSRLIEQVLNSDRSIRRGALAALLELNPPQRIARPIVAKALRAARPETAEEIVGFIVHRMGDRAVPVLARALHFPALRRAAAYALGDFGPEAAPAVEALAEALNDEDPSVRSEILFALGAIGPDAKPALPAVRKALKDRDMNVRYAACYAICRMGTEAADAKNDLLACIGGADSFLEFAASCALAHSVPNDDNVAKLVLPQLVERLDSNIPGVREEALRALASLKAKAAPAKSAVQKLVDDPNPAVRQAAREALAAIGG